MIFNHHRFQIWNQNQHPFVHSMSDFGYANPNLPNVTNMQGALDYLVAVIYPNAKPAVATPGDLPLTGNTLADYRVVNDDGDGKSAGYRWEQREGEATPSWHKIYDVDWSSQSILSAWQDQTLGFYVQKIGHDDADETGTPISGLYAGQRIFGGATANTNMTLSANYGDGAGPQTGYVQVTDNFRPTTNGTLELGTTSNRWSKVWSNSLASGTMTLASGSIIDTSGQISFGSSNLVTSGSLKSGTTTVNNGVISDTGGEVSFSTNNIRTTGDVYANSLHLTSGLSLPSGSQIADFTFTNGNIACATSTVNFNALNLTTSGTATAGLLDVDNLRLDGNELKATNTDGSIVITADGLGLINLSNRTTVGGLLTVNGAVTVTGSNYIETTQLKLQGNTISSRVAATNILLSPNGGNVAISSNLTVTTDNTKDIGEALVRFKTLYLGTSISDGSLTYPVSDLMSLKDSNYRASDRSSAAQVGDSLFWNGTQWLASAPDTEILHNSLSGLTSGDAGHTQFALLAGRSGGQSVNGGTGAAENLDLDSTSNVSKGYIQAKSVIRPYTDASYTTSWSGTDLGHSSKRWKDIYSVGEYKGFRFENVSSLPSTSSSTAGRAYYLTTDGNIYVDTGLVVKQVGGSRVYYDLSFNGSIISMSITVSGIDARYAVWQLKDNSNNFEVMYVKISTSSATDLTISTGTPLPAGTYRLIGV